MELQINENIAGVIGEHDKSLFGDEKRMIMITPPIGSGYWLFRVPLSKKQAILGFPKFMTIGIGFEKEDDWNTNLPFSCDTDKIYDHISHNKGDDSISKEDCIKAIEMIQAAAKVYKEKAGDEIQT